MNNIYVIVVSYNGMQWLPRCLESCKGMNVIVVDNYSTDNTVSFISEGYPEIILLKQNKNLGYFVESKYNKYWNREWYDFKFGVNYVIF